MERVEIRITIDSADNGLAIDDEMLESILQGRLGDPRSAARGRPSRLQPQPVAVILHFVQPVWAGRDGVGFCGKAEFEGAAHASKIGTYRSNCRLANPES